MNKKRKTASSGQTGDGQQMHFSEFETSPIENYIRNYEPPQGSIASVLMRGKENAITCKEISRITGLTTRQITERVYSERRQGAPIISSPYHGFWIASDFEDVQQCAAALHLRAGQIHETAKALLLITQINKVSISEKGQAN